MRPEDAFHLTVASMLTLIIAPPGEISELGVYWFSIEHRNAKSAFEGAMRKARGVVAGIPDIQIGHEGRTFWIELKAGNGSLSSAQRDLHGVIQAARQKVAICRTLDGIISFLDQNAIPHRGIC